MYFALVQSACLQPAGYGGDVGCVLEQQDAVRASRDRIAVHLRLAGLCSMQHFLQGPGCWYSRVLCILDSVVVVVPCWVPQRHARVLAWGRALSALSSSHFDRPAPATPPCLWPQGRRRSSLSWGLLASDSHHPRRSCNNGTRLRHSPDTRLCTGYELLFCSKASDIRRALCWISWRSETGLVVSQTVVTGAFAGWQRTG